MPYRKYGVDPETPMESYDFYQTETSKTAYWNANLQSDDPALLGGGICHPIAYCALKLCGECGEVYGKIYTRENTQEKVRDELGDVCWYVARLAELHDIKLSTLIESMPDPSWYNSNDLRMASDLMYFASAASEKIGKWIRDHRAENPSINQEYMTSQLGKVLSQVCALAECYHLYLHNILAANLGKVSSRHKRGKVGGEGDNR